MPLGSEGSICIALPGGAWTAAAGGVLTRRELSLRPLTAAEQVAVLDGATLTPAERGTDLLARCLTDGEEIAAALSVGDREAALLHLRRITIGDTIDAVLTCPSPAMATLPFRRTARMVVA